MKTRVFNAAELIFAEGGDNAFKIDALLKRAETSVGIFTADSATMKASFKPYTTASRSRWGVTGQAAVNLFGRKKTLGCAYGAFINQAFAAFYEHRNYASFFILHRLLDPGSGPRVSKRMLCWPACSPRWCWIIPLKLPTIVRRSPPMLLNA